MQIAKYQGITDAYCRDFWGEHGSVSRWSGWEGYLDAGC